MFPLPLPGAAVRRLGFIVDPRSDVHVESSVVRLREGSDCLFMSSAGGMSPRARRCLEQVATNMGVEPIAVTSCASWLVANGVKQYANLELAFDSDLECESVSCKKQRSSCVCMLSFPILFVFGRVRHSCCLNTVSKRFIL